MAEERHRGLEGSYSVYYIAGNGRDGKCKLLVPLWGVRNQQSEIFLRTSPLFVPQTHSVVILSISSVVQRGRFSRVDSTEKALLVRLHLVIEAGVVLISSGQAFCR